MSKVSLTQTQSAFIAVKFILYILTDPTSPTASRIKITLGSQHDKSFQLTTIAVTRLKYCRYRVKPTQSIHLLYLHQTFWGGKSEYCIMGDFFPVQIIMLRKQSADILLRLQLVISTETFFTTALLYAFLTLT